MEVSVSIIIPNSLLLQLGCIVEYLDKIRGYLQMSNHPERKSKRWALSQNLVTFNRFLDNIRKSVDKPKKSRQYKNVESAMLLKDAIEIDDQEYSGSKTINVKVPNLVWKEWHQTLIGIGEELLISKARRKKKSKLVFAIYAPGLYYFVTQIQKAVSQPLDSDKKGTSDSGEINPGHIDVDLGGEKSNISCTKETKSNQNDQGASTSKHVNNDMHRFTDVTNEASAGPSKQHMQVIDGETSLSKQTVQNRVQQCAPKMTLSGRSIGEMSDGIEYIELGDYVEETVKSGSSKKKKSTKEKKHVTEIVLSEETNNPELGSQGQLPLRRETIKQQNLPKGTTDEEQSEVERKEDLKNKIDELHRQVTELKKENARLTKCREDSEKEIEKLKQKLNEKKEENPDTSKRGDSLKQKGKSKKGRNEADENKIQSMQEELESLGRALQEQKKISEDLRQRLSKEMGDKISANESSVENISIKNRPMNIRDDYSALQSNEWLDAKNYLDGNLDSCPEERKVDIMCDIMKIISEEVTCAWDTLNSTFQGELLQPVKYAAQLMQNTDASVRQTEKHSRNIKIDRKRSSSLPRKKMISPAVTNAIGDFFRQWSDGFDYESLVKITTNKIQKKTELRCLSEEVFKDYIAATVKICWMMAIQRPPMTFDFSEKWYGETHQELFWGSVEDKDADVHVVFPILWHGKSVMGKGKVLRSLKKQSTYV